MAKIISLGNQLVIFFYIKECFRYYVINNHKHLPGLGHLHSDREKHVQEPVPEDW